MKLTVRGAALAVLTSLALAPCLANAYSILHSLDAPILSAVQDTQGYNVTLDYVAEVWDDFPGNPPTYFQCYLKVDGNVVQSTSVVLPNTKPDFANVVLHWSTLVTAKGTHTITFTTSIATSGPESQPWWYRPSAQLTIYVP